MVQLLGKKYTTSDIIYTRIPYKISCHTFEGIFRKINQKNLSRLKKYAHAPPCAYANECYQVMLINNR